MAKERLVNMSCLCSGHIIQDVLILDDDITGEQLVEMLDKGDAITSVHEDNDVVRCSDWKTIGKVVWSETEVELEEFQMEAGEYEQETHPVVFDASRIARKGAIGEFIADYQISTAEIMEILIKAGDDVPEILTREEGHQDKTGNQLLREINLFERGLMNLMQVAYDAGKDGKELI